VVTIARKIADDAAWIGWEVGNREVHLLEIGPSCVRERIAPMSELAVGEWKIEKLTSR
jgi:hypothetical protein